MPSSASSAAFSPPPTYPSSTPSPTAEACAELAALTVRVFTPAVVASVRDIFSRNPRLDLAEHLPLLGTLVVRHVSLSLSDEDVADLDGDDEETPQSPVLQKHEPRVTNEARIEVDKLRNTPPVNRRLARDPRRRGSYREIAYNAVRQKRIVPETLHDEKEGNTTATSSTAQTRPVKRLSIRSMRLPRDEAMRKTRSIAAIDLRRAQPDLTEDNWNAEGRVVRRKHSPTFWKEEPIKKALPRASASTSIPSPPVRRRGNSPAGSEQKENRRRGSPVSGQSRAANRTAPLSKLVQLRKLRQERRERSIR